MIYGTSGIGKSSLAALAPNAVFVGVDDGAKRIIHPVTQEHVDKIRGVETFEDILQLFASPDMFKEGETVVIDTVTKIDEIMIPDHVVATNGLKGGGKAKSIRQFGWDGHTFIHENMQKLIALLDHVVSRGVNVILLAQQDHKRVENSEGADYISASPRLRDIKTGNVRDTLVEWCDHVFRIGYDDLGVVKAEKEKTGKVQNTDAGRAIYTCGAAWLVAKTRQPNLPAVIDFAAPSDNLLWHYLFGQDLYYNPDEEGDSE